MAKWCGKIGFVSGTIETSPGIWEEGIIERKYYGYLIRNSRRFQSSGNVIDNVAITNEISIIADPYANSNLQSIKYVEFMGTKWKISNVSVQYPRLVLSLGDVYNA